MSDIISSLSDNIADEAPVDTAPRTNTQPQAKPLPVADRKLGVALVGLGAYSENQLMPALKQTAYCQLTGVVSGSPAKRDRWQTQHDLLPRNVYSYEDFDAIESNRDIDIVYIVLPNAMHAEFVIRAARTGKHVICEKPLATSIEDCQRMIEACSRAGVKLSVGYRLHFDPFNQEMMRLGQNRILGSIERITAAHGMDVGAAGQWRLNKALAGGGPLMDLGIYCVQAAMYTSGSLPVAVTARFLPKKDPEKFKEVEESIEWEMEFGEGLRAFCSCSYSKPADLLRTETIDGWFELKPAYAYSGLAGKTSQGDISITSVNQQAAQMDDFALCIQNREDTRVPGEMGLRDMQILLAIYEAAHSGKRKELHLNAFEKLIEI
jgi:predicted dehydrogenase